MLTLEFKAELSEYQNFLIERWFEQLKFVWNKGKAELDLFDDFHRWDSKSEKFVSCCPVHWKYKYAYLDENDAIASFKKYHSKILVPYCEILSEQSRWYQKKMTRVKIPQYLEKKDSWGWKAPVDSPGCVGYSCTLIATDYREASITSSSKFGLTKLVKNENIEDELERIAQKQEALHGTPVLHVPYKYRQGYIMHLGTSWQEYSKSRKGVNQLGRRKPKFKGDRDQVNTIIYCNDSKQVQVDSQNSDRLIKVPKLGTIKCRGLTKRWVDEKGKVPEIKTMRICKRSSGFYIQLTGEIQKKWKLNKKGRSVGIDPGVKVLVSCDNGKTYDNPHFIRNAEKHRSQLEKKLAAKRTQRLILWLNHPDRTPDDLRVLCPAISTEAATELLANKPKNELDMQRCISSSSLNRLKFGLPQSKADVKLANRIARKHEKVGLQRRHLDHKITTYLTRSYEQIAIEGKAGPYFTRKPRPKVDKDEKTYEHNGAEHQSELNKDILDATFGRKRELLKQKCKETGRKFYEVEPYYTTQNCPVCGARRRPDPDRIFRCKNCDWICDRDINAGINIVLTVYDEGKIPLESLSSNAKKALDARIGWCKNQMPQKKTRKRSHKKVSDDQVDKGSAEINSDA